MSNNSNSIAKWLGLGFVSLLLIAYLAMWYSTISTFNKLEGNITTSYEDSKLVMSNGVSKVKEKFALYKISDENIRKFVQTTFNARTGDEGYKAQMLFLKENNIPYDNTMVKEVNVAIESYRNQFQDNQRKTLEFIRVYKLLLDDPIKKWLAGDKYPRINFKDYESVLTNDTRKSFETKVDEGIELK